MPGAARLSDTMNDTPYVEHSGHTQPCKGGIMTGHISAGCSSNVTINGIAAATVDSITSEYDACCGGRSGKVTSGSSIVNINGKPAARCGDTITTHTGTTTTISGCSSNVSIN